MAQWSERWNHKTDLWTLHFDIYIFCSSIKLILFLNYHVKHKITITIRMEAPDHETLQAVETFFLNREETVV
ncbi:unnamed protein product [Rotaria magnacalcarata]|uniref:Uncharacterized protein n=2 Tax=Rotaria magnacalcarata TaxID=392030 RepID=A0A815ALT5_9BILA|nr:unnamed protein product [Rotaria magnacalcarata]